MTFRTVSAKPKLIYYNFEWSREIFSTQKNMFFFGNPIWISEKFLK